MKQQIIKEIKDYFLQIKERRIESLFLNDNRFKEFSREASGIFLDFSKTNLDGVLLNLLKKLLDESSFMIAREDLFQGKKINWTEDKPALHTAIRSSEKSLFVDNKDVKEEVDLEHHKIAAFCKDIQSGILKGSSGKQFTDIVNIGIGGSQIGPEMIIRALKPYKTSLNIHFISNIDPSDFLDSLEGLNPETTLFIIVSKSFKTLETLSNALFVEGWLRKHLRSGSAVDKHLVAVSSDMCNVENFSIQFGHKFKIHDFVGGRYSFWGVAGISIMLGIGVENFMSILDGGSSMDEHFRTSDIENNLPALLGLIGVWHSSFCNYGTLAIIPYEKRLEFLPKYVQQLQMESNGKTLSKGGEPVSDFISPIVWGDIGTNSQHSFFQYLHQGMQTVPCEFVVGRTSSNDSVDQYHEVLKLNCVAQSEALMLGKIGDGKLSHTFVKGNKPSITLLYEKLDPFSLGALTALYEHKVFVEGVLLEVNSFDQFGVELGKNLVEKYLKDLESNTLTKGKNSNPSNGLLRQLFRNEDV